MEHPQGQLRVRVSRPCSGGDVPQGGRARATGIAPCEAALSPPSPLPPCSYISEDQPAGWDVVALSDQFPNFAGSCGRCYEVKCDPRTVKDG